MAARRPPWYSVRMNLETIQLPTLTELKSELAEITRPAAAI